MNRTKPETDPLKARKGRTNDSLRLNGKSLGDPGTIQDYESRRMLKRAEDGVRKNNKLVYITFFIEFVVLVLILSAWITLMKT